MSTPEQKTETLDQIADDLPYRIVEEMGLGLTFRSCSCGRLPCARLRPIRAALDAVRRNERERCAKIADAVEAEWIAHARNTARADDLVGGLAQSAYNNKAEIANGIAKAIREGK